MEKDSEKEQKTQKNGKRLKKRAKDFEKEVKIQNSSWKPTENLEALENKLNSKLSSAFMKHIKNHI